MNTLLVALLAFAAGLVLGYAWATERGARRLRHVHTQVRRDVDAAKRHGFQA